jgi:hypothetical protein
MLLAPEIEVPVANEQYSVSSTKVVSPADAAITVSTGNPKIQQSVANTILMVRDTLVILDIHLAVFYETTTSAVNQYRKRNEQRFTSDYAFQLTEDQWNYLKSQNVISSGDHGGRRYRPWVYTEHGVAMMSMGMKGDKAAELSKIIIDTFVSFRRGTLPPERVISGPGAVQRRRSFQEKIYRKMEQLLDAELPLSPGRTLREELGSIATSALDNIKEILKSPGKQNEKVSAEITKILAEAEKLYAETRKINEEADAIALQNQRRRMQLLRELRTMAMQLERDNWLEVLDHTFNPSTREVLPAEPKKLKELREQK